MTEIQEKKHKTARKAGRNVLRKILNHKYLGWKQKKFKIKLFKPSTKEMRKKIIKQCLKESN